MVFAIYYINMATSNLLLDMVLFLVLCVDKSTIRRVSIAEPVSSGADISINFRSSPPRRELLLRRMATVLVAVGKLIRAPPEMYDFMAPMVVSVNLMMLLFSSSIKFPGAFALTFFMTFAILPSTIRQTLRNSDGYFSLLHIWQSQRCTIFRVECLYDSSNR